MTLRRWVYVLAGTAFLVVMALTAHDQLLVEYGDDSSYLLGKATPAVTWILTLVTPFALYDFFRWVKRSRADATGWAFALVSLSFVAGWFLARGWSIEWLVEQDIEVSFDRDEYLEIVIGLWSACAAALIVWITIRSRGVNERGLSQESDLPAGR